MTVRRRVALATVATLAVVAATPSARVVAKGASLLPEAVPLPVRPLALARVPAVTTIQLPLGRADLYRPAGRVAPGIVLVPGANDGGPADPRVRKLAAGFSRLGRSVLVPYLALAEQRLDRADLERILSAIVDLSHRTRGKVVVVAFSYGAGLTLAALEDRPEVQSKVQALATVGTYFDLAHLLEGLTTGQVWADGRIQAWRPPTGSDALAVGLLADWVPPEQRRLLIEAYARRDPSELPPEALSVYALMTNQDPRRTRDLMRGLPPSLRGLLEELTPASRIERLRVPVFALHSRLDPAAPALESIELVRALRPRTLARLALVGSLRHVTPVGGLAARLRDAPALVSFSAWILRWQEPLVPRILTGTLR